MAGAGSVQKVWEIVEHARNLACPSFAAWLQVSAFTGPERTVPSNLDHRTSSQSLFGDTYV
jgi:hypothetical protein